MPNARDENPDRMGFAHSDEQAKTSDENELHYSAAADEDPTAGPGPNLKGSPSVDRIGTTEENKSENLTDNGSGNPTGRGLTTSGKYPGPGTAADRGYGRTSDQPYGTGLDNTGMGDDTLRNSGDNDRLMSNSGLNDPDLGSSTPEGYGTEGDQGYGLTGAGGGGQNTAGSDDPGSLGGSTSEAR